MWKSIPGYESIYEVSNTGEVKSLSRVVKRKKGRTGGAIQTTKEKLLKPTINTGYVRYFLTGEDKKLTPFYAHVLVWLAFKGPIPEFHQIDHIDGDKENNNLSNLQCIHRRDHHRISTVRGQRATYQGKLKKSQVIKIKALHEKNKDLTQQELANIFGVSQPAISAILTGRTYQELDTTSSLYKRAYKEGFSAGYAQATEDLAEELAYSP